ncbi:hypothetical protein R3I94_002159 [Phoxinus phoxinus]
MHTILCNGGIHRAGFLLCVEMVLTGTE